MRTLAKKQAEVKPEMLKVGVDLGLDKNVVVVLNEQAQQVARFQFAHTRSGYDSFYQRVKEVCQRQEASGVMVGMEPTNYFWKLLAADLERQGWNYRLVNPYTVHQHREGDQLDPSRDDPRDAFTIADLLRTGKFTQTQLLHGWYALLRTYARLYDRLQGDLGRQKTLLRGLVGQAFPELTQVFKALSGQTARALLGYQACAVTIRQQAEADFLAGVKQANPGTRLGWKKLRQAHALARVSVGLEEEAPALQLAISQQLDHLAFLQGQVDQVRQALLQTFGQLPGAATWLSVPGIGPVTAACLLAELGDPQRFTQAAQWVKLAGIQPAPNQSGRKSHSRTPMAGKGRPRLRTSLYFICLRLIQLDAGFRQAYLRLQQRSPHPLCKMQALGVLMNKLLRVLWALLKHQCPYRSDLAWADPGPSA
jgi:transposase